MRSIVASHRELFALWPLSIPLAFLPCALSLANALLLGWSCAVLLFTLGRLAHQFPSQQNPSRPVFGEPCTFVRRFAWATAALQALPVLWIAGLWTLQGATGLLLSFDATRNALAWTQSLRFANVLFWLVLFGLVCILFRISRTLFSWHRRVTQSVSRVFLRWVAHSPGVAELLFEEVSRDVD